MRKERHNLIAGLVIMFVLCMTGGCGGNSLPDYPPDMVSNAYHTMSREETYRMHGKLTLMMNISGKEQIYTVDITAVSLEDPREITVKQVIEENEEQTQEVFLYYNEELDEQHSFVFDGSCWIYEPADRISDYEYAVPFGLYFSNIVSFRELAADKEEVVLTGTTDVSNIVYALRESGVLKRFALTSLTEEMAEQLDPIKVKAWIDRQTGRIVKAEADMTDTVKKMATLLYYENRIAGPQIVSCKYSIDSVNVEDVVELPLPSEAEKVLRESLKES